MDVLTVYCADNQEAVDVLAREQALKLQVQQLKEQLKVHHANISILL